MSYLGYTRWKTPLEAEIMRFMFISTLLWLVSAGSFQQIDPSGSKGCSTYKVTTNVTVYMNLCAEHVSITDKMSRELCVQKCNGIEQCPAVFVNTSGLTSDCCFITHDPVPVAPGNNTLYLRHDVITSCAFGYDPSTGCKQCLQDYSISAYYSMDGGLGSIYLSFTLNFHGPHCASIRGTVSEYKSEVDGNINRDLEAWELCEVRNDWFYRARLVEGNMVDGTREVKPSGLRIYP